MENDYNIQINPEYLYLTIPSDWVCIYHKILVYMADFGKEIVNDCTSSCKGNGKNIFSCWNLFQTAIACRELGKEKEANFFINYVNKQLEFIYKGTENKTYNGTNYFSIVPDGTLRALCSCVEDTSEFYVDIETGKLYEKYLENEINKSNFYIEDNDLIIENDNKI